MSSQRKRRSIAKQRQTPDNALFYPSYYPQYGYVPPSYYDPTNATLPGNAYDQSEYIYHPVDPYGNVIGPPTRFPPITDSPYYEPYPYPSYTSDVPTYGFHLPPAYASNVSPYGSYPPPPSRRQTLPPIRNPGIVSSRHVPWNPERLPQYSVRDITERDPQSSVLSYRDALRAVQYYDRLRRSYY